MIIWLIVVTVLLTELHGSLGTKCIVCNRAGFNLCRDGASFWDISFDGMAERQGTYSLISEVD